MERDKEWPFQRDRDFRESTKAEHNILTWDRAVLVVDMVAGLEIDFLRLLLSVIRERDFKVSTTYPFPCTIFELCRVDGVPIWRIDVLHTSTWIVDIGLIKDKVKEAAPNRGPQMEVQSLDETSQIR